MTDYAKRKHRWRILIIIAALLVGTLGIYRIKRSRTDADVILTISEHGFEGHFYGAPVRCIQYNRVKLPIR